MSATLRNIAPISSFLGGSLSLGSLYAKYLSGDLVSNEAVDDRAYRIYKNEGQNKVDKYSIIGTAAGMSLGNVRINNEIVVLKE